MLSKEGAAKFTELTAAPSVVQGGAEGIELTPGAASVQELVDSGGDDNWNMYFHVWYTPLQDKMETIVGELAAGRLDAAGFCAEAQKAADETAADPSTKKRTRS
jgi:N-acetylglucosamine transport system substrate-binding protein